MAVSAVNVGMGMGRALIGSSPPSALMFSRDQSGEWSWVWEESLWPASWRSRAEPWRRSEQGALWSRLVQLPSVGAVRGVSKGERSEAECREPCTSREHRSSEEQLWSGRSATSDTMREALSTEAAGPGHHTAHVSAG